MLLICGWRRGPERVSGHVRETVAAPGSLAVACAAAGDLAIHPYARLMAQMRSSSRVSTIIP
jgi:hypothetical protein